MKKINMQKSYKYILISNLQNIYIKSNNKAKKKILHGNPVLYKEDSTLIFCSHDQQIRTNFPQGGGEAFLTWVSLILK